MKSFLIRSKFSLFSFILLSSIGAFVSQKATADTITTDTTLTSPTSNIQSLGASNITLTNDTDITVVSSPGVQLSFPGTHLINTGNITSTDSGVYVSGGSGSGGISIINNVNSSITSTQSGNNINYTGIVVSMHSILTTLTNFGTIGRAGGYAAINVQSMGFMGSGSIATLNNAQGVGNASGALTYSGPLPTNYNIIINNPSNFGQLAVSSASGATTFGIYTGSTVANGTYAAVLSGLSAGNLTATTGSFGTGTWTLSNSSGSIWDLILAGFTVAPTGPSAANTQQSLVNTAQALQGTYTLQNSILANSFSYDCTGFGENGICISAGGRNTAVSAANGLNNTSGLLIAAYRPHQNYRVGAYVDQNLSVNNAGSTVNLGNNTPLIGLFGAWNERLDGTGTEVKVSAAYGQKNTTVNRSVVGSGATASEAGSGSSALNSQGAQVIAKYGFGLIENVIVSPYIGMRYTQNNMGGYTEGASATVTAPLTYSALNTNATTALVGVGASYKVIPTVTTFASAGVETDTNTANGTYSATGVSGLTPLNLNASPVRTRPTATLGAYYDIVKNQRLGVTGIYRQEAYQAVSTATAMATYTVGL